MSEITLSDDLQVITAEINSFKQVAGQAVFEIGKRLKHVKENDLTHGEFGKWLESIDFNQSQASRFIKVYEELGNSNLLTSANIGFRNLLEIASLPPEKREQPQTIPSTGEVKTPSEMTTRELQEVKKALKEAEQRAKRAEKALGDRPEKIVIKEDKFKLEQQQKEVERLRQEAELLRKKAQLNDQEAMEYKRLKEQIEFLNKEKNDLDRRIKSATELSGFALRIDNFLKTELSPIRYARTLERMDSEVAIQNLTDIIEAVESWCEDMRRYLPNKRRIEVEVIE